METITTTDGHQMLKYSFAEKYFDILPEGRIRRRQYLGRGIGGALLVGLIMFIAGVATIPLMFFVSSTVAGIITLLFSLVQTGTSLWMSYALGTKRIRDIGKNVEVFQKIFYFVLGFWGIIAVVSTVGMQYSIDVLSKVSFLVTPLLLLNVVLFVVMLCTPGQKGETELGKDPMNTKLGFLG